MFEGESITQLIGNFGFPIIVTIYLLYRFENKIESLENALRDLEEVVRLSSGKKKRREKHE
ncbi:hypothetical protein HNO89_001959 [Sporosarcina luteola]|nr:hypothetical protein [Sporosarcina luteola]